MISSGAGQVAQDVAQANNASRRASSFLRAVMSRKYTDKPPSTGYTFTSYHRS